MRRRALAAAALLGAMFVGALAGRSDTAMRLFPQTSFEAPPVPEPPLTNPNAGLYLFLLHRPEGANAPGRGQRYQQWADELRARGLYVRAEALQSTWGWMLRPAAGGMNATPIPPPAGDIEGFFLIAASDSTDVLTAARLSPHFDYGGNIEVRRVVQ